MGWEGGEEQGKRNACPTISETTIKFQIYWFCVSIETKVNLTIILPALRHNNLKI